MLVYQVWLRKFFPLPLPLRCTETPIPFIRLVFVRVTRTVMIPHIKRKHKSFLYLYICTLTSLISAFVITFVIRLSRLLFLGYRRPEDHRSCTLTCDNVAKNFESDNQRVLCVCVYVCVCVVSPVVFSIMQYLHIKKIKVK